MANVTFDKKIFEKEIGKIDEKMQNKIIMFGTEVEKVTSEEIEVEITPDRPDLLSYQGFKRSFLSFLGKTKGMKEYKLNKPQKDFKVTIDSSVKKIRPYTVCAIIKNLSLNDERIKELIDIQEKLHTTIGRKRKKLAIGIYPLEKIKLPITFKALEPDKIKFIPLESPGDKEMSGLQILQRHPAGRDYSHLLAGKTKFPIFVDAAKNILSMPPIINSQLTGKVTEKTKDVFVEVSGFDYETQKKALNILITTMAEMGGEIYQMEIKGAPEKISPNLNSEKNKLTIENTNKLLGLNLNETQLKSLIEKMGHNYNRGVVESPAWRADILHEVDLIEDIAIAYGYENFEPEIPEISTIGEEDSNQTIKRKIAEILSGLGMLEVSNYHLTKKQDQFTKMGVIESKEVEFVQIEESKTEYNILRKDISHYLLKNIADNSDSEYPQKIFETGIVFKDKEKIIEKEKLAAAIIPGNFTELKQILEYLSRMLGKNISLKETEEVPAHFIDGRIADIMLDNKKIGQIGEVHPKILKKWKIKMPVATYELDLEPIFRN
jgi:phenylalanyl-tRNA synthetase beta chain